MYTVNDSHGKHNITEALTDVFINPSITGWQSGLVDRSKDSQDTTGISRRKPKQRDTVLHNSAHNVKHYPKAPLYVRTEVNSIFTAAVSS